MVCCRRYFVGTSAFRAGDNFFAVAVLLLLYGITNPCLVYAISFMFDKHTSAQTFTMLVYCASPPRLGVLACKCCLIRGG